METIALIWHSITRLVIRDGTKPPAALSHTMEGRQENRDEDAQYVALCQGGEPAAFEVLVRRHQKRMFNIAYRMTGNYEDAGDVVQEAFLGQVLDLALRHCNKPCQEPHASGREQGVP